MTPRGPGLVARAFGVLVLWTIVSSATFVLLGRLWVAYPPPLMFWQWWHYALMGDGSRATWRLLGIAAAVPTLLLGAGGIRAVLRGRSRKPALYGETLWATEHAAERAGFRFDKGLAGGGLVLGRHERRRAFLTFPGDEHVALYAPTRTGKGVSFVIPNCLRWQASLVCLDLKRENWHATAGRRQAMGQHVFLFDPLSPTSETVRWNPFSIIERGSPDAFNQLQMMASTIFPELPETSNSAFWTNTARSAWIGVAALVAETPAWPFTMATVLDLFTRPDAVAVINRMIEQSRADGHPYTRPTVRSLLDYIAPSGGRTDLYESVRKSVTTRLALWQNARVCAATEESDFDLRLLRLERMSIYVAVQPGDIERLSPLLGMFFQQVVNVTCRSLPENDPSVRHRVLMLLDEFPTIGPMPHLAKAFAFLAGYGLRVALVLQDPPQLDGVYGRDVAKVVLDNCGVEVVFGTKSQELTEQLSKRVGDNTTTATTEQRPRFWASFQWSKQSESEHPHRRPLMLPQEIARLPDTHEIVIRRGVGPIRLRKIRWFADPVFAALRRPPPVVPPIAVSVPLDTGGAPPGSPDSGGRRMDLEDGPEQVIALSLPGGR